MSGRSESGRIVVVEDDGPTRELVRNALVREGYDVVAFADVDSAEAELRGDTPPDVMLTDIGVGEGDGIALGQTCAELHPDVPVVTMTGQTTLESAVRALRSGAYDYLMKPLDLDTLLAAIRRAVAHRRLTREVESLRREVGVKADQLGMVGESAVMRDTFDLVERAAASNATVLVSGESGTGKELVARAIHRRSGRDGRFLAVNCAAMPATLLESELFGHVRGAFTDAKRARDGLFVQASGGTLFLDEIGELDMDMQPKLLRVLQEKTVRPVGGNREIPFDTRIVAATNIDLEAAVTDGEFREDLYYRIHVINIGLPPLRARGHDVLRLAQSFLERFAEESGRPIRGMHESVADRLLAHDWPGNVRELQNCIERGVALARGDTLVVADLPPAVQNAESKRTVIEAKDPAEMPTLEQLERRYVRQVLDAVGGQKASAARVLGIDRRTLYRKLERWAEADGA